MNKQIELTMKLDYFDWDSLDMKKTDVAVSMNAALFAQFVVMVKGAVNAVVIQGEESKSYKKNYGHSFLWGGAYFLARYEERSNIDMSFSFMCKKELTQEQFCIMFNAIFTALGCLVIKLDFVNMSCFTFRIEGNCIVFTIPKNVISEIYPPLCD
ncbi:MAG: hypothetical protein KAJ39_10160 [Gammaproteobacteria bacterium]|nr:hypothetical protein [Gammaproteobacteria bacterium]